MGQLSAADVHRWWPVAASIAIAVSTTIIVKMFWFLGSTYMQLLVVLALIHVVVTMLWFRRARVKRLEKLLGGAALIVGQWWAVEMLAMQIFWRLGSFAP